MQIEITEEFILQVKEAVQKSYNAFLKETFEELYPSDAAEVL